MFLSPAVYNMRLRVRKRSVPCFPSGSPRIVPHVAAHRFTAPEEEACASIFSTNCSLSVRSAAANATPVISVSVPAAIPSTSPANTPPNPTFLTIPSKSQHRGGSDPPCPTVLRERPSLCYHPAAHLRRRHELRPKARGNPRWFRAPVLGG